MTEEVKLSPNDIAFVALAVEYCNRLDNAFNETRTAFISSMLKLLPRLYISATDIQLDIAYSDYEIDPALDEDTYNAVRDNLQQMLEPDDVYLEVFVADMKYSDTPIAVTISENLADIYQEMFNIVASVKDKPTFEQRELIGICKNNFKEYWGQTLCNVLRALHNVNFAPADNYNNY